MNGRDIVLTWPKTRPLASYLAELRRAVAEGLVINYRVARPPVWPDAIDDHGFAGWPFGTILPRCYMVHSGFLRGWTNVVGTCRREAGEVDGWPAGIYVVREPLWHPLEEEVPVTGFRGWRWAGSLL